MHDQLHPEGPYSTEIALDDCPVISSNVYVFSSASATFFAPSDESGIRGMKRERIRSTHQWRNQGPRRDCALVVEDENQPGLKGLTPVRVMLFFSFIYRIYAFYDSIEVRQTSIEY